MSDDTSPHASDPGPAPTARPVLLSRWARLRLTLLRIVAVLGAFLFVSSLLAAFSGMYTSRPEFCRSCHNMEPYYVSWQQSSHSHVSCIKCHFPPGVGEKIRGKLLGLVQLAKYVTSSESPRPAAEVSDASCLRGGCHETRLLSGKVDFNGVPFDHGPHLGEMRRGKKLRCTSCHSQIVQGSHMTVTASTCFLCHFKDEQFNHGLGACTRCHQIPKEPFDLGGGAVFDHELSFARGVSCTSCHGDLIRGNGEVPHERCTVCHNRQDDLGRIDDHVFIHQKHVTEHSVDCLDCHLTIQHSANPNRIEDAAHDCASCHPDHHRSQIQMFEGLGGKSAPAVHNAMVTARITCNSCHQSQEVSASGGVLWAASNKTCAQCHDNSTIDRLWAIHHELREALESIGASLGTVRARLAEADPPNPRAAEILAELQELDDELQFLRVANGIHNIHYASTLTGALVDRLTKLCRELNVPPPNVNLPARVESSAGDRS